MKRIMTLALSALLVLGASFAVQAQMHGHGFHGKGRDGDVPPRAAIVDQAAIGTDHGSDIQRQRRAAPDEAVWPTWRSARRP